MIVITEIVQSHDHAAFAAKGSSNLNRLMQKGGRLIEFADTHISVFHFQQQLGQCCGITCLPVERQGVRKFSKSSRDLAEMKVGCGTNVKCQRTEVIRQSDSPGTRIHYLDRTLVLTSEIVNVGLQKFDLDLPKLVAPRGESLSC